MCTQELSSADVWYIWSAADNMAKYFEKIEYKKPQKDNSLGHSESEH